jgi:hypothetical protein
MRDRGGSSRSQRNRPAVPAAGAIEADSRDRARASTLVPPPAPSCEGNVADIAGPVVEGPRLPLDAKTVIGPAPRFGTATRRWREPTQFPHRLRAERRPIHGPQADVECFARHLEASGPGPVDGGARLAAVTGSAGTGRGRPACSLPCRPRPPAAAELRVARRGPGPALVNANGVLRAQLVSPGESLVPQYFSKKVLSHKSPSSFSDVFVLRYGHCT